MKTNELSQQEMQATNGGTSVSPTYTGQGQGIETPYDNTASAGTSGEAPYSDGSSVGTPADSGAGDTSHPMYTRSC